MKTKILLTGASGSVGHQALLQLIERKEEFDTRIFSRPSKKNKKLFKKFENDIEIIWGDLRDPKETETAVKGVDAILHFAAVIPPLADEKPEMAKAINTGGTKNILDAIKKHNKDIKLIYTSSISVYGDRVDTPEITVGDPLKPSVGDEYAKTKIASENLIKESGVKYIIFRLTYITSPARTELDPLLFHMPLDTSIEILQNTDTAFAAIEALKFDELFNNTYNLAGGEKCRTTFREYINTMFEIFGLKADLLPEECYATQNFHCGFYTDTAKLQEKLKFQRFTLEDYYNEMREVVSPIKKFFTKLALPLAKRYLISVSEPYQALKKGDKERIKRFYKNK